MGLINKTMVAAALALAIGCTPLVQADGSWRAADNGLWKSADNGFFADDYDGYRNRGSVRRFIREERRILAEVNRSVDEWREIRRILSREIKDYERTLDDGRGDRGDIEQVIKEHSALVILLSGMIEAYRDAYLNGLRVRAELLDRYRANKLVNAVIYGTSP